jgi:quercetin dioxygenase-like cupin family protein
MGATNKIIKTKEQTEKMKKILYGFCFIVLLASSACAGETNTVQVDVLAKTSLSWDSNMLPSYSEGTPEVTILRIQIPPGMTLPLHQHPVINAGVLLRGQLTVVTEDQKTLHLKAGESIVEVVNKWHCGKNEGKEVAEIIVFYAGVLDKPITIKTMRAAKACEGQLSSSDQASQNRTSS